MFQKLEKVTRSDVQEVIARQEQERELTGQETGPWNSFRAGRTNSGACQFSVLRIRYGPIASTSMRVRLKQSIASSGAQTIGSFSLKLVFRITGIPVLRSKAWIRS